ncbi:putative protein phosphatase 2c 9 [Quercus suber]|uniref:PPM-type phosphatase domain-containing protein n=1 Tax=Quercus suber TaxID=58331 RepID=A0AAW0IBW7_QUESU
MSWVCDIHSTPSLSMWLIPLDDYDAVLFFSRVVDTSNNPDLCHAILSGDVPRVNGQLAVSRAFGDKSLKSHLRSDPDIQETLVDANTELLILASDGLWKVMPNQEAVDIARRIKDPQKAAKQLTAEALKRDSKDDISCVVVRFKG